MGVDLRLHPIDFLTTTKGNGVNRTWGYSHTILDLPRRQDVWPEIRQLESTSLANCDIAGFLGKIIPDGAAKGEHYYGRFTEDPYGKTYTMVFAEDLGPVLRKHFPDHPTTAYVSAMPPDDQIVLGWH